MDKDYIEIEDILTEEECDHYIDIIKNKLNNFEIISNTFEDKELTQKVSQKIKKYININYFISPIWFYAEGSRIGIHKDGSKNGSIATLLLYLSDGFEKGRTIFRDGPTTDSVITGITVPKKGKMILLKQDIYHEGETVAEGVKFVLRNDLLGSSR